MTPLGSLIAEVQEAFLDLHGVELTYGDIARRSRGRLNRQRVQQLAKDPINRMPSPEKIAGLAAGLGVPESVVTERALTSAGYAVPRAGRRDEARHATAMTPTQAALTDKKLGTLRAAEDSSLTHREGT